MPGKRRPTRESRVIRVWKDSTGHLHRVDGPAYEDDDGHKVWYWRGNEYAIEWDDKPRYRRSKLRRQMDKP